jgi:hypothetical protein
VSDLRVAWDAVCAAMSKWRRLEVAVTVDAAVLELCRLPPDEREDAIADVVSDVCEDDEIAIYTHMAQCFVAASNHDEAWEECHTERPSVEEQARLALEAEVIDALLGWARERWEGPQGD